MKRAPSARLAAVAAAVLIAAPALSMDASPAAAAPHRTHATPSTAMPAIGAEIPSNMTGANSVIELSDEVIKANLTGGIKQRTEVDPHRSPARSVLLRTTDFHLEGMSPDREFKVTIALKDADTHAQSNLRLMSAAPPRFTEHDVIVVTVTVERRGEPALTLESHTPLSLSCSGMTQFPPVDNRFELERQVDLYAPGATDPSGHIRALPTVRGGNVITPQSPPSLPLP
ncbi:hypothetical protein [Streptomyces sp. MBT27]|uniref:hypothetical protein n=1 Tax=Streptomyces sp. MBT27 TaxID=1488356 RepID=UPI001423DFC0|nr:hypothetical protein [Streptomyces sp. MBT27]